jgi:hypothetical protein
VKAVKFGEEELKNARSATENTLTNANALTNDVDSLSEAGKQAITAATSSRERTQGGIKNVMRAIFLTIFVQIGRDINSDTVQGENIVDLRKFFRDWRFYEDNTIDEKVTGRAVTYASEPAASVHGVIRRLTVGRGGTGDKIESGRHNGTVTARVSSKQGWRQTVTLSMGDGPADELDYTTGSKNTVPIEAISEVNTGSLVGNATLRAGTGQSVANNTAITALTGWTLTNTSGSPTPAIETTAAKVFRSLAYSISVGGASTTWTISRNMEDAVTADPFRPALMGVPFYMNAGWAGDITLGWGSKTQAFTEADLTATDWVWLFPDRDMDLYPVNFDKDDPEWSVSMATDAANANEIVIGGVFAAFGTIYEDVYYWYFADQAQAVVESTFTMADSATNAGEIQDTIGFVFDDDGVGAYLMTGNSGATSATTLADPA